MKDQFLQRLTRDELSIGIIGLGYVGLPLALRFAEKHRPVIGFDIDDHKVTMLQEGESYISHIEPARIETAMAAGMRVTSDFALIAEVDAIIICVPTPLGRHREPDLSFIIKTMEALAPFLRKGQLLSLESTTYPGTTEEVVLPYIRDRGFSVGEDFFVVYSPEREDPGNHAYPTHKIPKICGGVTEFCLALGVALYETAIERVVPVSSPATAEMTKLLENIHRAVNIGLVNEMKIVADRMGINIHEVIRAAATKPFGFTPYYPGPGLGGHCIPIDPFYLTWKAKEYGVNTRFIELAGEVNSYMPHFVIEKVVEALNGVVKAVRGSKILVLGLAYKKNVNDVRESPSVHLLELLQAKGAEIAYSDPFVPVFPKMREHHFDLASVEITAEKLAEFDCVLLATDHDSFDYEFICRHARLIVDTRGRYAAGGRDNVHFA